jgi:hypothetical protein
VSGVRVPPPASPYLLGLPVVAGISGRWTISVPNRYEPLRGAALTTLMAPRMAPEQQPRPGLLLVVRSDGETWTEPVSARAGKVGAPSCFWRKAEAAPGAAGHDALPTPHLFGPIPVGR